MDFKYFLPQSASSRLVFSIIIVLISFVLFFSLGMVLVALFFNIPLDSIPQLAADLNNPRNIQALKVLQIIQTLGIFIVPCLVIASVFSNKVTGYLGLDKNLEFRKLLIVLLLMVSIIPIVNILSSWNEKLPLPEALLNFEEEAGILTRAFIKAGSVSGLIYNLFIMAVLPALGEEFLFRGVIQKQLIDWFKKPHVAIFVASLIFSAIHFQFLGFAPRLALGMLLGYLFYYGGNLWMPIIAHFLNNAVIVLVFYFSDTAQTKTYMDTVGTDTSIYWALPFSVLVTGFLFWNYIQLSKEK
jgi:uncharacterized protein